MGLRRPLDRTRAQTAVRAALLVSIASVLAVLNTAASTIAPRTRERPAGMRSRVDMPYKMAAVSDLDFRLLFRMDRDDCWALLGLIRGRLETNEEMAILSSGQPISAECRLAMALRILAGASYVDVMLAFGVGRCTVFYIFRQVCNLLFSVWRACERVSDYDTLLLLFVLRRACTQ